MNYFECLEYYKNFTLRELYINLINLNEKLDGNKNQNYEELINEWYYLNEFIYKKNEENFDNLYNEYYLNKNREELVNFVIKLDEKYSTNEKDSNIDSFIKQKNFLQEQSYLKSTIRSLDYDEINMKYKKINKDEAKILFNKLKDIVNKEEAELKLFSEKFGINSEVYFNKYSKYLKLYNELEYIDSFLEQSY